MKIAGETITVLLAVIGTVLGIVNSYWIITSNRVDLSIRPYPALKREGKILMIPRDLSELKVNINRDSKPEEVLITITNTGRTTAYVTGIGFIDKDKKTKFYLISPDLETQGKIVLSPNEPKNIDTKVTAELRKYLTNGVDIAFAETSGGRVFLGSTTVWEYYVQWLRKPNNRLEKDAR